MATPEAQLGIGRQIEEKVDDSRKKLLSWLAPRALFIAAPVLALGVITACDPVNQTTEPTPTLVQAPTPDLGENNVPFVRVDFKDWDGDGDFDVADAWAQKGIDWRAGHDTDFNFVVDDKDETRSSDRECKLPVGRYDSNGDRHVRADDTDALRRNKGPVENEPGANIRLSELMGTRFDLTKMVLEFKPDTDDQDIEEILDDNDWANVYPEVQGDLTPDDKDDNSPVKVAVQLPLGGDLEESMSRSLQIPSVIKVHRYSSPVHDELNPQPDSYCEATPVSTAEKSS